MASSNACWGVEIGAGGIKALKLELDGDRPVVSDFMSVNHAKVLSTPDLDQDDVTRLSLGTLVSQKDLTGASLAISMPGHQSFARFAKLPPVEPKKVPDIVKFEAVQQIPFPLEDVEWDYQTFVSPDSPEVEVGIFAITRPRIMEKLQLLNDVGLTPDIATLSPVAAYNALAYDLEFTEDTPGTIIVDIGTTATDIVIADGGRVWVRTFPIGGHQFTDALVSSFKLSYSKAERLKREAEQTKHARHVFQAMRPVFTDLVQEIQRSIGFYQSVHAGADLKRVIGLGSTFGLPGLRRYLRQQLQMDVYTLEQYKRISVEGPRGDEFGGLIGNMGTAYGLALQGLGFGTLNANLMPVAVVREAMWKRKRAWFGVAAGLAAAAGAAMFIRPLIDQTAIAGAERPASIDRLVREAGNLSREAAALGVTGAAAGDTSAAEIVGLLDGRDLYPHVVADVNQMFAEATALARADEQLPAGVSAFTLESLAAPFRAAGDAGDRRGAPTGRRQRGGADEPTAEDPTQFDRVDVTLVFTTSHPDPTRFVGRTVERWLQDNANRDGVPYRIVADERAISGEDLRSQNPGGTGQWGQRPGGVPGYTPPAFNPGGARGPAGGGGTRDDDQLVRRMEQIAPIAEPVEDAGPEPTYRVSVQYSLVLESPLTGDES
jgi:type IV pilus assembly protein PilM